MSASPDMETLKIAELIARAPWREAVTYRNTWPHEYVLSRKDNQRELIEAVCARFRAGEGVACRFFNMRNTYLFIGDYKYWLMTHWDDIDLDGNPDDYVLNRARAVPRPARLRDPTGRHGSAGGLPCRSPRGRVASRMDEEE